MTTSPASEPSGSALALPPEALPEAIPDGRGRQRPRIYTAPPYVSSSGQEAVELAAMAGLHLDSWQQFALELGLAERADGKWAAFEVAVNVPRQNGKGAIIEARELAGLFLLGEELILHSAHEFKTAKVAFKRIERLIKNCDSLRKRVKTVRYTTGEESIELLSGAVLRFLARSGGSGRGFTGHCNVLDEAMILGDEAVGALMPTVSAIPNPQMWYLGSAGIGAPSVQLASLRRRALEAMRTGEPDPALAYLEWSISPHAAECPPDCTEHDDPASPLSAAKANPALGYRISQEHVNREMLSMSAFIYARERLGVGDYPAAGEDVWRVVSEDAWRALTAPGSQAADPVAFAIDATPERSHAAICAAGTSVLDGGTRDGVTHVEVTDHRSGLGWVVPRAVELQEKWSPLCWIVDAGGPAGSLIPDLEAKGIEVVSPKARQVAQACGGFLDAVADQTLTHLDQAPLAAALAGAELRPLGDASAWSRRGASVDISPLVAATHAVWGLRTYQVEEEAEPWAFFG